MRVALSYARGFGGRIVQHPEDPSLADGGAATEGELATRLGLPGIPVAAEAILVARDIRLAALTGGAVHFAHVSTAEALRLIRQAKADGIAVTCDTAPPYFDLNETAIGDFRTYAKLSPPLRKEADRLAVVAALADGTIDAIASDHQPRDADDKRQPFALATPGGTGLATLLGVTLAQVHSGALALAQAIELLTARPAALLGVRRRPPGQGPAGGSLPVPPRARVAGGSRPPARQGAEHAVRRPRAGGRGAGHVEGRTARVRVGGQRRFRPVLGWQHRLNSRHANFGRISAAGPAVGRPRALRLEGPRYGFRVGRCRASPRMAGPVPVPQVAPRRAGGSDRPCRSKMSPSRVARLPP